MEKELNLKIISQRAIRGALSLTFRRVALQAISFITINLLLARILPVETLGIFNIAAAVIAFFSFFSDIGLAAALIQKKTSLTLEDLRTTFTIQTLLAFILFVIIWFSAPFFTYIYALPESSLWLIRALGGAFFLTSLKVIPSVVLERNLKFNPLVSVEILETLVFNVSLIILVKMGAGVNAFSLSAILRSSVGVISIYLVSPWRVGLAFSKVAARGLLTFGIPFQANTLLAMLKDRLVPLLIARMIGPIGIGYITWAQNLAFLPLEIMNIIIRVTFPTLSRLQTNEEHLSKALDRSLFATTLFLYPTLFGMIALAPSLVAHVVSVKWAPALPAFYLFCLSSFWATLSTTFTNTLNAIGEIKVTLKLMLFWTALTWILTPILTLSFGFLGVAISSAVISFTSVATVILIKRRVKVSILENIWQPLLASVLMSLAVHFLGKILVRNLPTLLLVIILGAVIYLGLIWILAGKKLRIHFQELKYAVSNN